MDSRRRRPPLRLLSVYLPLAVYSLFVAIPLFWALSTSLKTEQNVVAGIVQLLPHPFTLDGYRRIWSLGRFSLFFANSLFISAVSVCFVTALAVCNGYALSRFNFRGKRVFMFLLLSTQLLPLLLLLIPLFIIFTALGFRDSAWSLIIFYTVIQTPFNSLLMKGFIDAVPLQIDEAAMIDGAGRLTVITQFVLPVIVPGIVATMAFAFIGCWNEFLVAFTFISSRTHFTIPIGLKFLIGEYSVEYATLAAGSLIALMPPLALFVYIQRHLVTGLASGAVKG